MKMYRAIIRDTRYEESYKGSVELFKTKKSLKEWFELREMRHYQLQGDIERKHMREFSEVLIGIEEVNVT